MAYTPRKSKWLGTFQTGDLLTFRITTRNGAGTPTIPDACPTYQIALKSGDSVVTATKMAIRDRYALDTSGANNCLFESTILIDSTITTFGNVTFYLIYKWRISSALFREVDTFGVDATIGDPAGQILALDWLPKSEADFVLNSTADGDIEYGRNPF